MQDLPFSDRRKKPDRRSRPTFPFSRASLNGNRKHFRRKEDRDRMFYVDIYSPRSVLLVVAILVLSTMDAVFTLRLIEIGAAREFNPVMDYFIHMGAGLFLLVKYSVTGSCAVAALVLKNHRFWAGRFQVRGLLGAVFLMYAVLILYELFLTYVSG